MPLAEWTRQTAVILTGAFLFTKHVAQLMIDQGRSGSIINIVSTRPSGEPWNIGYCTGKSGLLNFTRSVAMELAEYGIRVNSLTPTATDVAEGLARAAVGASPFDGQRTPAHVGAASSAVPRQGTARQAPVQRTTPKPPCFLPQMMPP